MLHDVSFTFGDLPSEAQFPWVGKILGDTQTDIGEFAVRVSGKGPRASDAEVLHRELRIGPGRNLRWNLLGRLPSLPRSLNLWIVPPRFLQ
jgi:hypothetical protein